jgi:hypothetical protein
MQINNKVRVNSFQKLDLELILRTEVKLSKSIKYNKKIFPLIQDI